MHTSIIFTCLTLLSFSIAAPTPLIPRRHTDLSAVPIDSPPPPSSTALPPIVTLHNSEDNDEQTYPSYYYVYENEDGISIEAVDLGAVEAVKEAMKAELVEKEREIKEKDKTPSAVKASTSGVKFRAGLDRGGMHKRVMGPDGIMQDA